MDAKVLVSSIGKASSRCIGVLASSRFIPLHFERESCVYLGLVFNLVSQCSAAKVVTCNRKSFYTLRIALLLIATVFSCHIAPRAFRFVIVHQLLGWLCGVWSRKIADIDRKETNRATATACQKK